MEIKGTLDEWGCPTLNCVIVNTDQSIGFNIVALIDTGCYPFLLKSNIIKELGLKQLSEHEMNNPLTGVNTRKNYAAILSTGIESFKIIVSEMEDSFNYDLILGTNFIKNGLFNYEGQSRKWSINI